jgi:outer membrane protein assembly factor BamB
VIENPLLLISTLDGSLIAVDQRTGDIRWNLIDGMSIQKRNITIIHSINYSI